jgi:ABC-type transporter Mla subunit MlaD
MAHDGNTQRDRAPRPSEAAKGDRPSERAGTPASGRKPLFSNSAGPKAGEAAAAPIPLKPLPRFNAVPQATAAKRAAPALPSDIPLPNASAVIKRALHDLAEGPPSDIPLPDGIVEPPAPPPRPSREVREAAAPAAPAAASKSEAQTASRRPPPPKRRPAAPPRARIAANDDAPSIGGLIFALQQRPSNRSFMLAATASGGWLAVGSLLAWAMLSSEIASKGFGQAVASPVMIIVAATVFVPIAIFWFLALLAWRAQELKLMSSAMTEVAVRLAEPDRAAEQSAASLGQAVRRQVSFMNEAISRALGRAGELEGLVHNEVASLEKAYAENENKIRGLIQELAGERHALVSTTEKVSETLKAMGSDVPMLIDRLSQQQVKLAKIIEGAGQNLIALESQLSTASGGLETTLANRTQQLQAVLDDYTVALDATLASRAEALDIQLLERTRALDEAFAERLSRFDDAMVRSTVAIDSAVNEKARALTHAMESHVRTLSDTLGQHASNLDESMMHGLDAVRRSSDSVTRQSLHAIEGLSGQADLLKSVSENLLKQMAGVASQGQSIARAANALESANMRIDTTLQKRQGELNDTLQRLSGKADHLDQVMRGYSQSLETVVNDTEDRARNVAQQMVHDAAAHSKAAAAELERLRTQTDAQAQRAMDEMRAKVSGVSQEVSQHLGDIASRFNDTSEDLKTRAARAAAELELEQERIRAEAARLPQAARESAESMRSALSDQLRALEQLSSLSARERRDVTPPTPLPQTAPVSLTAAFAAQRGEQVQNPNLPIPVAPDGGDRWTLGDLLARASREDGGINIASISRALDPTTASAIWSRFRAGQRGIMVRSIYTSEGRTLFDDISARYRSDTDFRRVVDRFLVDFEWLARDIEQKDPSGRSVHSHLVSDSGRVYLFLAHASGRLR